MAVTRSLLPAVFSLSVVLWTAVGPLAQEKDTAHLPNDKKNDETGESWAQEGKESTRHQNEKYDRRLLRSAMWSFAASALTSGAYITSDVMFYNSREIAGIGTGIPGLCLAAVLTPTFFSLNRSSYRHFGVSGERDLQTWGWIASGLAFADALTTALLGIAAIVPIFGMLTLAGLLTVVGWSLFAIDALHTRRHLPHLTNMDRATPRLTWTPFLARIESPDNRYDGIVLGIEGSF